MKSFYALIVAVVVCWMITITTMGAQSLKPLRVMTWNVENLFDTVHDQGFQDEEFLPQSERRWTSHRYWQKLTNVSKVIAAVAEDGQVPDLVGLCEVENDSVLHTLTTRSVLRQLGYHYVMTHCEAAEKDDYGPSTTCERWDLWYIPDEYGSNGELVPGGDLIRGKAAYYQRIWNHDATGD
jgi:hypothetical protein